MAVISQEDDCPICQIKLSQITDGSEKAKEKHVQTCIESHLSAPMTHPASASETPQNSRIREGEDEGEACPICHTSYLTKDFYGNDSAREAHFTACFEMQSSGSTFAPPPGSPPSYNTYNRAATFDSISSSPEATFPTEKGAASNLGPTPPRSATMPFPSRFSTETPSSGSRLRSMLGYGGGKNKEQKTEEKITKADGLMTQRWGPPGSPRLEMVRRYWKATRMEHHWEYLRAQHPRQFKKYLDKGYMEPIPVCTDSEQCSPFNTFGLSYQACLKSNRSVPAPQSCPLTQKAVQKRNANSAMV